MKLPNGDRAVVAIEKLRDYCLDPAHPRGRHKARVFAVALGWSADDAGQLRDLLLLAARDKEAVESEKDEYGQRYVLDLEAPGLRGPVLIRSSGSFWPVKMSRAWRVVLCYNALR